ncbi:hypothetical protein TSYNTROOL_18180 [Tepidanaerobacter syntrophicus]|uniref:hypothetical protein n=1 Tax=Tepidanaerobacter syntrophicus TaxID=224999 RepID=UPI0022ED69F8|nr:hypothetical protein [Tepidanaerobacter syntrophicus]GLI51732.1 hypothetical protein TSYNTROOL_18180 [Tepidanaerobacter syntrophicus]
MSKVAVLGHSFKRAIRTVEGCVPKQANYTQEFFSYAADNEAFTVTTECELRWYRELPRP